MRPFASTPSNICRRESFLSGSHFSAVSARFSGLSPPLGSLVAYPVGRAMANELYSSKAAKDGSADEARRKKNRIHERLESIATRVGHCYTTVGMASQCRWHLHCCYKLAIVLDRLDRIGRNTRT